MGEKEQVDSASKRKRFGHPESWESILDGVQRDISCLYAEEDFVAIHPKEDQPTNCEDGQSLEEWLQRGAGDRERMRAEMDVESGNEEFGR